MRGSHNASVKVPTESSRDIGISRFKELRARSQDAYTSLRNFLLEDLETGRCIMSVIPHFFRSARKLPKYKNYTELVYFSQNLTERFSFSRISLRISALRRINVASTNDVECLKR